MATTTIYELPLFTDSTNYRYSTALGGQSLGIRLYWNSRAALWHMDVLRDDESPIYSGVTLVPQYPLLADIPNTELPGYFLLKPINVELGVSPTDKLKDDPLSLASAFKLFYVLPGEGQRYGDAPRPGDWNEIIQAFYERR
ncbi:TPA: hypothetical protein ACRXVT_005187 [Pseudomonas aeruginosa]